MYFTAAGPIACIALDSVDSRYLLSVDTKANVYLHDTHSEQSSKAPVASAAQSAARGASSVASGQSPLIRYPRSLSSAPAARPASPSAQPVSGHNRAITAVAWYPPDTGLFLTGATDNRVLVWDTRSFAPAFSFSVDARVWCVSLSPCASSHNLAAVGTEDPRVRLLDLASGGHTHTLVGHRDAVTCLAWHPTQEYQLLSGSRDGTIRWWDVRKSGATAQLAVLDQQIGPTLSRTQGSKPMSAGSSNPAFGQAGAPAVSHSEGVNGLCIPHDPSVACREVPLLSTGCDSQLRHWKLQSLPRTGAGASADDAMDVVDVGHDPAALVDGQAGSVRAWNSLQGYPSLLNRQKHRTLFMSVARLATGPAAYFLFHPNHSGAHTSGTAGHTGPAGSGLSGRTGQGTITGVDVETGECVGVLAGHTAGVNATAWSESLQCLFSASDDCTLRRWWPTLLSPSGSGYSAASGKSPAETRNATAPSAHNMTAQVFAGGD